jgi:hypothetical protein
VTGSFTVKKATFGPHGWIQSFDATFVQHCNGSTTDEATGEVVINNGPAPADLAVTVTPDAHDTLSFANGQAVIKGTLECNRPAYVDLSGTVVQQRNDTATGKWTARDLNCKTTPTTWTATVSPTGSIPFGYGHATVSGNYSTYDLAFGIPVNGTFSQGVELLPALQG